MNAQRSWAVRLRIGLRLALMVGLSPLAWAQFSIHVEPFPTTIRPGEYSEIHVTARLGSGDTRELLTDVPVTVSAPIEAGQPVGTLAGEGVTSTPNSGSATTKANGSVNIKWYPGTSIPPLETKDYILNVTAVRAGVTATGIARVRVVLEKASEPEEGMLPSKPGVQLPEEEPLPSLRIGDAISPAHILYAAIAVEQAWQRRQYQLTHLTGERWNLDYNHHYRWAIHDSSGKGKPVSALRYEAAQRIRALEDAFKAENIDATPAGYGHVRVNLSEIYCKKTTPGGDDWPLLLITVGTLDPDNPDRPFLLSYIQDFQFDDDVESGWRKFVNNAYSPHYNGSGSFYTLYDNVVEPTPGAGKAKHAKNTSPDDIVILISLLERDFDGDLQDAKDAISQTVKDVQSYPLSERKGAKLVAKLATEIDEALIDEFSSDDCIGKTTRLEFDYGDAMPAPLGNLRKHVWMRGAGGEYRLTFEFGRYAGSIFDLSDEENKHVYWWRPGDILK